MLLYIKMYVYLNNWKIASENYFECIQKYTDM